MSKTIIEESRVLPSIDEQLEYVKTLRKDVMKYLSNGLDMVFAIEQNLLAVKLNGLSQKRHEDKLSNTKSIAENICYEVLRARNVSITSLRVEVLKFILNRDAPFSISDIYAKITQHRYSSRTAVGKVVHLFDQKEIIQSVVQSPNVNRRGRPEKMYKVR
jgi:hypothetical protein